LKRLRKIIFVVMDSICRNSNDRTLREMMTFDNQATWEHFALKEIIIGIQSEVAKSAKRVLIEVASKRQASGGRVGGE
jgi:hypothetical protein